MGVASFNRKHLGKTRLQVNWNFTRPQFMIRNRGPVVWEGEAPAEPHALTLSRLGRSLVLPVP